MKAIARLHPFQSTVMGSQTRSGRIGKPLRQSTHTSAKVLAKVLIASIITVFLLIVNQQAMGVTSTYLHNLSNFDGSIPFMWAKIALDPERNEVLMLDVRENDIRIFNEQGMETFSFDGDLSLGSIQDVAVGPAGDILLLTRSRTDYIVTRCNYRGETRSTITIKGVPEEFSEFFPQQVLYAHNRLYLVDMSGAKVILAGIDGSFEKGYDLLEYITSTLPPDEMKRYADKSKEQRSGDFTLGGFSVDARANLLFTTPALFAAYILSSDGTIRVFGVPGSSRGKFGVVSGIAADQKGFLYISDKLRSVVMVFDSQLKVVDEFGFRGSQPENLIVPDDLAVDASRRVYVSQAANRGVSVFQIEDGPASARAPRASQR